MHNITRINCFLPSCSSCISCFNLFLLLCVILVFSACSIPNLEPQSCIDSRIAVREFYSFHFGNNQAFAGEDLDKRKEYLTPAFFESLNYQPRDFLPGTDPFTRTEEQPKAFRVGSCIELSPERTAFQVLLFWKDDVRSEQRQINVEVVKAGDKWLIDRVSK